MLQYLTNKKEGYRGQLNYIDLEAESLKIAECRIRSREI